MPAPEEKKPVNCWQYSRDVYLLGRSIKFVIVSAEQRAALKDFIVAMAGTRPAYVPYVNLKADNPPANEYGGEGEERKLAWDRLELQNDYSLGKMIQRIGRSLKIQFCTADEKAICDTLLAAFAPKAAEEAPEAGAPEAGSADASADAGQPAETVVSDTAADTATEEII